MFSFPAQLTIIQVDDCKINLIQEIEEHEVIEFDDSAVERIDTVGVQLILATITFISSQNKQLKWHCQSKAIKESIQLLGINEVILNKYLTP